MSLLLDDLSFLKVMKFVYPEKTDDEIRATCSQLETVYDFQAKVSYPAMKQICSQTIDSLSYEGLDNLKDGQGHLIISNHRDIILDSALLNVILFENELNTTETAIGSNLLANPTVKHLTKLNKNFTVQREVSPRELLAASKRLSAYIGYTIREGGQSIWISQREGRSKDGNDRTQQGLLKMISMNSEKSLKEGLVDLSILPLSVSYEYDPCDSFKIQELIAKTSGEEYVKQENEDLRSIVAGISGRKGRVHLELGQRVDKELDALELIKNKNEKFQLVASVLDKAIHSGLKLFPNNYYSADVVQGSDSRKANYSIEESQRFEEYANGILQEIASDQRSQAKDILFKKYAWPVFNKEEALSQF